MLLFPNALLADVPAPPVNQSLGFDDTIFNNLVEAECRVCHDDLVITGPTSNVDRHHLLYGTPLPLGECSVNRNACLSNGDCYKRICSRTGARCDIDEECPDFGLGETCGEVCIGETVAPVIDADQDGINDTHYGCLNCHEYADVGGIITFLVERDCLQCHIQVPGEGSVHHLTPTAQGPAPIGDPAVGDCTPCHGTIVDDIGDGHVIPTYSPSLVTPAPSEDPAAPGGCNYCHDVGTDTLSGVVVFSNSDNHHNTGVFLSETGVINDTTCFWCHDFVAPAPIRACEGCHGLESLHNIQADSDASGDIVVGGELPGYGHVGADNPGAGSDCWGCHGFSTSAASGSGPLAPTISRSSMLVMTAGTDTPITLTGSAFTNLLGTNQWLSEVVLTAADESSLILTPDSITENSLTVTIPGAAVPGNYALQAVKDEYTLSNPVSLSIKPEVVIDDLECSKCMGTMTIIGSGFSGQVEGTDEYISVEEDGRPLHIISWTDTEIQLSGARCRGTVTITALFGSATRDQ
jgi:hypothetical protein